MRLLRNLGISIFPVITNLLPALISSTISNGAGSGTEIESLVVGADRVVLGIVLQTQST
jgi:hypothetical protein